jgi:hypothetical protein
LQAQVGREIERILQFVQKLVGEKLNFLLGMNQASISKPK